MFSLIALVLSACAPNATNAPSTNANINASANKTPSDTKAAAATCDGSQIIRDIRAEVESVPLLKSRLRHISAYSADDCVVHLLGYTDNLILYKKFIKIASEALNVTKVDVDALYILKTEYPHHPHPGTCCH